MVQKCNVWKVTN